MHNKQIVHRDLKCKNIVFDRPGRDATLKIIDFGFSEYIHKKDATSEDTKFCGTRQYMPPGLVLKMYILN